MIETDPKGLDSRVMGAKTDAQKVRPSLILNDMPRAILAIAQLGTIAVRLKYSPGSWLQVERGIERFTDAMDRHRLAEGLEVFDENTPGFEEVRHATSVAWNALARLELILREAHARRPVSIEFVAVA
ncbi:dATP/dGTP diphosphohydrolase domain-containing protein [Pararobbsia silviterrae]|uniref:dATP/dGTP diphosphohydrolase N-terminal domain-containing protein n=1 Tax=Pararobbsia silviterrae TaxID=1792498 RepID=A0A494X200_9BURK|nr:dATP/dGTP diphosphohydrolase domain-containing protein [Pararobbsia silviterrae]RKP44745.1 hypothetical protein D7S86_27375 [Pararobbsia silviterrae]